MLTTALYARVSLSLHLYMAFSLTLESVPAGFYSSLDSAFPWVQEAAFALRHEAELLNQAWFCCISALF